MRASQGASYGKYGELYHPEVFNDREEVIVFKREEFASAFKSMIESIEFIKDIDLKFNRQDDYKLLGLWPKIMSRVHIIDVNIDDFLVQDALQGSLDAFLYPAKESLSTGLIESGIKLPEKPLGIDWYK
jgi:hypothetical protein